MTVPEANHFLMDKGFELQQGTVWACNGLGLKNMLRAGGQWLELHKDIVNGLNVFPVPDGDTGTNMVLTMHSAVQHMEATPDHKVATMAAAAAYGALMGARGNSGVILSQFLQGFAQGLDGNESFTAETFALASEAGTRQAYQSVLEPVEGTILTVARAASEAARQYTRTNQDLVELLSCIVAAVKLAQANTPELLPMLKEAGVTDAGGQGLLFILEGALRFLQHQPLERVSSPEMRSRLRRPTLDINEKNYGYDVQFLLEGEQLDVEEIRTRIDAMGWSTLVVGDPKTVKVHVHVEDPDQPLKYGASLGTISDVVVEDMGEQARAFVGGFAGLQAGSTAVNAGAGKAPAPIATISIAAGRGFREIFKSLGADWVLSGGQTANPSTQELLEAIEQIEAGKVLILPNNRNIILTAQQAEKLSQKEVKVVPTKTVPQGIAALLSFNDQLDLETNTRRMLDAARQVDTFEITQAYREATMNGFKVKRGDLMGLFGDRLISQGQSPDDVTLAGLAQAAVDEYELITIYYGRDGSGKGAETLAGRIRALYTDLEVEVHEGGQAHSHYIISLE